MADAKSDYEFKKIGKELSNWGRWGSDDELGTINFITPDVRKAAAALVRTGKTFDLGMPFSSAGPQSGGGRFNPIHTMTMMPSDGPLFPDGMIASDDVVTMPLQCATQWDSLAHVGYDEALYNGVPGSAVTASKGAIKNSFDKVVNRLITRGVLLDIAGLKGVDRLARSEEITADDLDAAAARQGVSIQSGDVVMFRTGWYQHFTEGNSALYLGWESAGLGISAAAWLHDHEVAAVAGDNFAIECLPAKEEGTSLPVHMVLIRDLGMTLGEMFNFEELAADCNSDGVWEFLFSGIGIKVTASVGSPVTPIAIK
ncbi:MAG: cyclase family protein [Frankiales bacterium]|nr:cyclase family protein [Frankiales bacterium]